MVSVGRWVGIAVLGGMAMAAVRPAEACEPPPDVAVFPAFGETTIAGVPTDGVIAFRAQAYGELAAAMELLAIEVTQDGMAVEGAIETVELSTYDEFGTVTDLFVVWRPAAAFDASSAYVATVTVADPWDDGGEPTVTVLDVTTDAAAAGTLPASTWTNEELTAVARETRPRVCCDAANSCGIPTCVAPELADQPTLAMEVVAGSGPMLSQTYLRVQAGVDGDTEPYAVLGIAREVDGVRIERSFETVANEYCFGLEAVSLVDGTAAPVVTSCVDHGGLELGGGPNPDFEPLLDQCVGAPYWEDTMEPYEPGGTTGDSGSEGGSDEADGGSDEADGGSTGDESMSEEGLQEEGESGDDSGGQTETDSGCGCDVNDDRGVLSGVLVVVAGLLRRRRR